MQINARAFDEIARTVFAPIYPIIARQIVAHTGMTRGVCLDAGCGSGYLGAALASITELHVTFFDESAEMLALAENTIKENGLRSRTGTLQGDIGSIALPAGSVDLVISRGSIFFWEDLPRALREVSRILAPGGRTWIGGGFGTARLKESIRDQMAARNKGSGAFGSKIRCNLGPQMRARFEEALEQAGIADYQIVQSDDIGLWIDIRKEGKENGP
ncbi:class I SAM-dependent methyltransferase [Desulfobulbus elongatus]|uniref:class I SAM-dependent methyltransferase n=1 Tax=Desulfobulbus elongatus TaxID=53332 RepID=UPI000486AF58|nr:class I SAM-dependent methyltransferase [Desulfobulbus elongatus]